MSRILRLPEVCRLVGLSRSTVLRLTQAGSFAPKVILSARAVGWREAEVHAWIEARVAAATANGVQ